MPRKSKVESSPHFEEIVDLLLQDKSGRYISNYLKKKYNEDIGFNAINSYRRKHIKMEQRVEAELNRRAKEKEKEKQKDDNLTRNEVQRQADVKESIEESTNSVASTIADNMSKVAKVAANFVDDYEKAKEDAENDEIKNVTHKDVANLSLQANKLYNEYFKNDDTNVEVNIENNMDNLSNLFDADKIKSRLNEKRNRKS